MAKRFEDARRYTEKYKDIILPCRYCGSKNVRVVSERTIFDNKNVWYIGCCDCPDCGPENTSVKKLSSFGTVMSSEIKQKEDFSYGYKVRLAFSGWHTRFLRFL